MFELYQHYVVLAIIFYIYLFILHGAVIFEKILKYSDFCIVSEFLSKILCQNTFWFRYKLYRNLYQNLYFLDLPKHSIQKISEVPTPVSYLERL